MIGDISLETLAHGCAACSHPFKVAHRICSLYKADEIRSFSVQVELGIAGAGVRNFWVHLLCKNPTLEGYLLKPDIHICVECQNKFERDDMLIPVFQVTDPRAVNPLDPTDVGLSLGERVYFVHGSCRNKTLTKDSANVLHRG